MGSPFNTKFFDKGASPITGDVTQGNVYYIKPRTGLDSNDGTSPASAVKTVARAHTLMTANQNDIAYFLAEHNTASSTTDYQSATLTWSKNLCHLIGVGAPTMVSQRSRIAQLSTATGVSPLVSVTANGCYFSNLAIFHGVDDATSLIASTVSGERNVFDHIHFAGIGNATQSAAGCASLSLDAGAENVFRNCTIGLDTITRDGDGVGLLCDTAATRNFFDKCLFTEYISAAGACHVKLADTTAIDRWLIFRDCLFISKSTNKTVDMTEVFNIPAGISQGAIALFNCATLNDGGAPVWTAGTEGIIWANMGAPTAAAAGGLMTNL